MRRHRKLLRRHRHHHKTLVPARPIPPVGDGSSSTGAAGLPVASAAGGGASAHSADSGPTAVGSAPFGPAAPSGGWAVEYADAFGAPLGTVPGEDNTVWPSRFTGNCTNNPGFNGNEMEVFNCSQVSTDANGLELECSYAPNIAAGKNYDCGAIETDGQDHPAGYRLFNFEPGQGQEWALQIVTKFPPNSGEADPGWWASTPTWAWEWDMFEGFGSEGGKGGGWCSGNYVGTTDPTFISSPNGSNSTGGESYLCRDQGFDPSAGYPHVYDGLLPQQHDVGVDRRQAGHLVLRGGAELDGAQRRLAAGGDGRSDPQLRAAQYHRRSCRPVLQLRNALLDDPVDRGL